MTMSDKRHFNQTTLPVSQFSIELYQPIAGGIHLGGRFAPDAMQIPKPPIDAPAE